MATACLIFLNFMCWQFSAGFGPWFSNFTCSSILLWALFKTANMLVYFRVGTLKFADRGYDWAATAAYDDKNVGGRGRPR